MIKLTGLKKFFRLQKGFTLIELLIVVGIMAVLIGATLVAINPFRQFGQANNAARWAGITTIMNAVYQNVIDYGGTWTCAVGSLPTTATPMSADDGDPLTTEYDICPCLVTSTPSYLGDMPVDPQTGTRADPSGSCTGYVTGYTISQDATTGRITIAAPDAQLDETISITR